VLVVEDARDVREFLSVVLEDAGFLVQSAGSVEEALGVLRSGRGVDVVVADYNLGDGTGAELIHQASNEGHLDVKVTATLICTPYRYVELPPRGEFGPQAGRSGELLRVIERALEASRPSVQCRRRGQRHRRRLSKLVRCANTMRTSRALARAIVLGLPVYGVLAQPSERLVRRTRAHKLNPLQPLRLPRSTRAGSRPHGLSGR